MGRFARGALVGFLFVLTVGVWPAGASVSGVSVTNPSKDNQLFAGAYSSSGTPSGFTFTVKGSATTSCTHGFSSAKFTITGPNPYSKSVTPPSSNGTFALSTPWDTSNIRNGVYDVRLDVTERPNSTLFDNCDGQVGSAHHTTKVANPPAAPVWDGSPTAASDGSANVTVQWKKNSEPDIVEYHIFRSGPDGTKEAIVAESGNGCSVSSSGYSCTDSSFGTPYDGSYSYSIKAMRSRPSYNSGETQVNCSTGDPCVVSAASDVRQVTLTAPTPSPSPSPGGSPTGDPSTTPSPGGSSTPHGSGSKPGKGTGVLSFGTSRSGPSVNPFFTGTYQENLPYQPKSLIVGDGSATPDGQQIEAGAVNDSPPNYRTILLPVAGGLLAFLSAAHVRRLLIHF